MDESYSEAKDRLTAAILSSIRSEVDRISGFTRFNEINTFTAAQVEILLNHIDRCHKILFELAELNDHELPYRVPPLIYSSRSLRKAVS